MALVVLTFIQTVGQAETRREEVVDTASPRFLEIINMGGNPTIGKAPDDAKVGTSTITRFINFREDKDMQHVEIPYRIVNDKLVITDFKPFKMRGYGITVTETSHGDLLELDLNQQHVTITNRLEANDMINAIRRVQEVNVGLIDDLTDATQAEDEAVNGSDDNEEVQDNSVI